jgi:hypothetical protein
MLTPTSRFLTTLTAIFFTLVGAPLFVLPARMAPLFPWKVTPFVAMTIGAWCLGNAWLAGITARRRAWRLVYTACLYLWLFGILELGVLVAFRQNVVMVGPISWAYVAALVATVLSAGVGLADWIRFRPSREPAGPAISRGQRAPVLAFILFVGFLALYGMMAPPGAIGTQGGIFPETMSAFTLRSFAAFYLALALAVIPFLSERSLPPLLHHSFASYGLIVLITLAALVNLSAFDFVARPGGLLYLGAYFAVGVPVGIALLQLGTGSRFPGARPDGSTVP